MVYGDLTSELGRRDAAAPRGALHVLCPIRQAHRPTQPISPAARGGGLIDSLKRQVQLTHVIPLEDQSPPSGQEGLTMERMTRAGKKPITT